MRYCRTLMARVRKSAALQGLSSARWHWAVLPLFANAKFFCLRGTAAGLKVHHGTAAPLESWSPHDRSSPFPYKKSNYRFLLREEKTCHVPHVILLAHTHATHVSSRNFHLVRYLPARGMAFSPTTQDAPTNRKPKPAGEPVFHNCAHPPDLFTGIETPLTRG